MTDQDGGEEHPVSDSLSKVGMKEINVVWRKRRRKDEDGRKKL